MNINYILIDFENVQPKELSNINIEPFKIKVFAGASQKKVPIALVNALQPMGSRVEYIQISGKGPNALDFHIAFYIGWIAKQDQTAHFYIISKDQGFDPLIKHLKAKGISVKRLPSVNPLIAASHKIKSATKKNATSNTSLIKSTNKKSTAEKIQIIIENLEQRGAKKPRTVKTLSNTINSLFLPNKISDKELTSLIGALQNKKIITINDLKKVSYTINKQP